MEREKQEGIFLKPKELVARVVFSGMMIGTVFYAVNGLIEARGMDSSNNITARREINNPDPDDKIMLALDHKEERFVQPSPTPLTKPASIETPLEPAREIATSGTIEMPKSGPYLLSGRITYYGVDDGYGLNDTLGCTGEAFDPYDPTTAARPNSSPFKCGDRVRVCDHDSCIEVVIKDTCPGCDANGLLMDLSKGAIEALTGQAASTEATLEGPLED
ncbi:hypothetical protein HY382_02990 [Candidatus Curtissbacteria bacterium]|nr:hypothetical protein [Candidatus Curtissbacteria bacterium]